MSVSITALKQKLEYLQNQDKARKIFGAAEHQYQSQPVSIHTIKLFEQQHKIELPEEYKVFLREVGLGAGPNFGLQTFRKGMEWLKLWNEYLDEDFSLNKDFELTTSDALELIHQKEETPTGYFYKSLTHLNGILPINYEGCTYYTYLVVSGEQKGKLWGFSQDDALTLPAGVIQQVSFLEWYEDWLDKSLKEIKEKTV